MDTQVDIIRLATLLKSKRGSKGLRAVAQEIGGVSASTLSRIERGEVPDLDTFIRLCRWLDVSPQEFVPGFAAEDDRNHKQLPMPERIAVHLRADRTLDQDTIEALVRMVRLAYNAASKGELNGRNPDDDETRVQSVGRKKGR